MGLVLQLALLSLFGNVLFAHSEKVDSVAGSLKKEQMDREEKLRKEFFGGYQSNVLLLQVSDLIKEVTKLQVLAEVQSKNLKDMESKLTKNIENMAQEIRELKTKQCEKNDELESKLVDIVEKSESRLIENINDVESSIIENIEEVGSKVQIVDRKIEVGRSEVRLISQQKLTWQNSTYEENKGGLFPDYAVDGVYTLSKDDRGVNPIQGPGDDKRNNMLIVDLGGFFKIHTVKVWNRVDAITEHNIGLLVYAGEDLLGAVSEHKFLYNYRAKDNVFASKIYLKQSIKRWMRIREVQVFGTGPYDKDEFVN